LALNSAEYRFLFPVIGFVLSKGRTKLSSLSEDRGPPLSSRKGEPSLAPCPRIGDHLSLQRRDIVRKGLEIAIHDHYGIIESAV